MTAITDTQYQVVCNYPPPPPPPRTQGRRLTACLCLLFVLRLRETELERHQRLTGTGNYSSLIQTLQEDHKGGGGGERSQCVNIGKQLLG